MVNCLMCEFMRIYLRVIWNLAAKVLCKAVGHLYINKTLNKLNNLVGVYCSLPNNALL